MNHATTKREQNITERTPEFMTLRPHVDIYENKEELLIIADMPGVKKENIHIELKKDELVFEGKRQHSPENSFASEFWNVRYHRAFQIHQEVDTDKIKAELKDGILRIHLPKSPSIKPRQIEIHTA